MAQDYTIEPAEAKVELVSELRELVGQTKAAILTDYRGLSVAELTDLRKKLREVDAEYRVVKNTLFKLAAGDSMPISEMSEHLSGPTAIGFAKSDPVAVAKILLDYARDHKAMSVKAGVMDGRGFVGTLSGILSNFVFTLQAIADKQGGGEAEAAA
jgi:large subunit ribosomal protein L10